MLDRRPIDKVPGSTSLGFLADGVALAALRYACQPQRAEPEVRPILERAVTVMTAVMEVTGPDLVAPEPSIRSMTSAASLAETLHAVRAAGSVPADDLVAYVRDLVDTVNGMLTGTATKEDASQLQQFFERLSELTLHQSDELIHPHHGERPEWMNTASRS